MTPTDGLAVIGEPPLGIWRPTVDEVHISVTFTWDIETGERLRIAWANYYPRVKIGGPALDDPGSVFVPGRYLRDGIVITSRGCPHACPWCFVPQREGSLRLLPIQDGWIVQDNNLLATPREHQLAVYEMLRGQSRAAVFSGGLDARLVDDWVTDQLRSLRIHSVFLAADTNAALIPLREAVIHLQFLGRNKLRCYVMIGHEGETIKDAEKRLEAVWQIGCLPFAQLYQPLMGTRHYDKNWKELARVWSRPAIMRAKHSAYSGS